MVGDAPFKKSLGELSSETKKLVNILPKELETKIEKAKVIYPELEPNNLQFQSFASFVSDNENNSFNIVVLGPTGCGKSTIINQLFNRTVSATAATAGPVTQELEFFHGDLITSEEGSKQITIIDTIGKYSFYDNNYQYNYIDINEKQIQ